MQTIWSILSIETADEVSKLEKADGLIKIESTTIQINSIRNAKWLALRRSVKIDEYQSKIAVSVG